MPGTDRPAVAVFDIDGVLADVRHRLHHLARTPKDWDAFFTASTEDAVLEPGRLLARQLAEGHDLLYLTGRPERIRVGTDAWLRTNGFPPGPLWMWPDDDHRPARQFKRHQVRVVCRTQTVAVVVDDDPAVIAVLAGDGVPTRLADWLPYTEALGHAQETDGRT